MVYKSDIVFNTLENVDLQLSRKSRSLGLYVLLPNTVSVIFFYIRSLPRRCIVNKFIFLEKIGNAYFRTKK